ncbi:Tex16 [Phodopus roborovskii]|uniref:Tex16 protein n=1 Tax=Phodopus roborovskii TaxID=109678 RepID=A0AAU9YZ95_PHORO|nr:Tex16 [Phodopus roborovskii]
MASDSIKRLMTSEKTMMETENFWKIPDSESIAVDSSIEKGRTSISKLHLIQMEKIEKQRSKRYMEDSDSETSEMDSDSERHELASAAVKCFMDTKTFHLSTASNRFSKDSWSERRTVNSDSESPVMSSDSVKHLKKAETCKSTCNLERLKVAQKTESLQDWLDAKRKQLDSDHSGHWDNSGKYQFKSIVPQDSFGKCQGDLQTFQSITEKDQVDSSSEEYQKKNGNERNQNEPESKRTEKGFDNEGFQMVKEKEGHLMESDRHDSENEAHRLGARRKDNRPPVCRIQLARYKSEDKTVRFKEASSSLSDKQLSQEKIKEKHSDSFSPESHTFTHEKYHRKASRKLSFDKRHCREYRYAHGCESFRYQITSIPPSSESSTSNVSSLVSSPNSKSRKSATRQKTRRSITYSLDVETQRCTRCFMEISNSSFHKCPTHSDDSDSDSPLHEQISSYSKYSLRSKTTRHFKTSRNSPLSQSLDPKHHVGMRCALHREDFRHSVDSTSYLHCESCSALRNLKSSADTHTIPIKSKQIMGQHSTHGHILSTPVRLSESESKFNLTTQPQNKDNPDDSLFKFISARNINDEADVEEECLSKDETDQEYETNTEDETDAEDETDTEDEDNNKDKKDPKDKSDPDGSDPKDGNSENNTDSNTGSDPNGASGPTSGSASSNDGDSKNVTDRNNESDPASDNASNSDVNLKYSTDLNNVSDMAEDFNQHNNDTKSSTNPNSAFGNKNRTVMDYISGSNSVVVPSKDNRKGNICSETIRPISHNLDFTKNETDPNNNPFLSNSHGCLNDLESNYNTKLNNAAKPTSTAIHKLTAALKYYSDFNVVTGFTYKVRSSFLVTQNYFGKKKCATRPSFAFSIINANDTSNITSYTGAISSQFTARKNYAPENKHFPRFSHFNGFSITIKDNQKANNSISISNINILTDTELKTSSMSSSFKIVYGTVSNFIAGTNHTSYPIFLITSEFYDSLELGRAYIIFDNQNFSAQFQNSAGYTYSDTSKYASGSVDSLDAKESGFLKDFCRVQNPIGIKDPSLFKILSNQNIPLSSFDVIVEAELPDVVKFAISSGAVNQLFKVSLRKHTFQVNSLL